jgi:hypothetical protein
MFITKKHVSRRAFIRSSVGATIALPFLDAMVPAQTPLARTAAAPSQRFGFIYVPHGSIMKDWTPAQEGSGFQFSPILKPLERFRDQLTVLTNLSNNGENGHSVSTAMWLSGTFPAKGSHILLSTTVDQMIAQHLGQGTTFPSIELATEDHSSHLGSCAGDFLCSYMSTISWRTATQPQPMEINPRVVFERMFGDTGSTDPRARRLRLEQDKSVIDSVTQEVSRLQGTLGQADRAKLTEYLEAVRDVERRIQKAEAQSGLELPVVDHPAGIPASFDDHVRLMCDLQVLAYQSDLTRVVTLMLGREFSGVTYPQIGVPDAHHPITHHQQEPEKIAKVAKINAYHVTQLAYLLEKLRSTPDGDGSLLDHIMLVYGTGMGECNAHDPRNIPVLLAGGGCGQLKGGRHIAYAKETPLANLHLTLLDKLGIHLDRMGDSTGRLDDHALAGI